KKKTQGWSRPAKPSEPVSRKMLCGGISEQKCSLGTNFLATLIIRLSGPTAAVVCLLIALQSILGGDLIALLGTLDCFGKGGLSWLRANGDFSFVSLLGGFFLISSLQSCRVIGT